MIRFVKLLILSILAILILTGFSSAQIPLLVQERAGITRSNEPVTLGVPFAQGELLPTVPVRIVDPNGNPVNAQFKTMAIWDDGSIRWLKCDFQASVNANNTAQYTLERNALHPTATELTATETSAAITVTTGPLRFAVSKTRFNLFDQAWLDLNGDRQYANDEQIISSGATTGPVVTAAGINYFAAAQPPERIEIEEQGPMKVVIKVSGRHYNAANYLLKYETRIYAYAGKAFVKAWHVYANGKSVGSLGDTANPADGEAFDRYALDLQLNLTSQKTARFGGDEGNEFSFPLAAAQTARLLQSDRMSASVPLAYSIGQGATVRSSGARAEGWGDLSDGKWGLLISSRYFWQKYPKGLAFNDNGHISVEPAPTPEFLWVAMGTGDEMLFYFHPASEAPQAKMLAMSLNKNPLFPRTLSQQYASSQAFYALMQGPASSDPAMNSYIKEVTNNHLANRENLQLYGNINFGDVPRGQFEVADFRDESTWGENYYDGVLTAARLFAQSGDLRFVDIFVPMARHFMETACWNTYDPNDWMNGFCPAYSSYHRSIGHFNQHYGEGIWYYYYLTGDERAHEIGLRAAESIVHQQPWGNENVACRTAYQRGSACLEAWKNTRDPKYLNHAKHLLVDKILVTQDTFGLIGAVNTENNTIDGEQSWMMALYSDALWKYLKEAPDPVAIAKFARLADFLDRYARKNPGVEEYWNLFLPPNSNQPPARNPDDGEPTVYWDGKGLIAGTYAYV